MQKPTLHEWLIERAFNSRSINDIPRRLIETPLDRRRFLLSSSSLGTAALFAHRDRKTPQFARKGRASYLGERSAGHQDPGATSTTLLVEAAASTLG